MRDSVEDQVTDEGSMEAQELMYCPKARIPNDEHLKTKRGQMFCSWDILTSIGPNTQGGNNAL